MITIIATELALKPEQVAAAVRLLDAGNQVPFIARYRKEVTGGIKDTQLRQLETRLLYLRELDDRKQTILKSITDQGKLSDVLRAKINHTLTKTELEDLYLPYKPKRRTKGQIAIAAGLASLADRLWQNADTDPEMIAATYINADYGIYESKNALDGARAILMERFAEDAVLLAKVRHYLWQHAHLVSSLNKDKRALGHKFADYFAYHEAICTIPAHRTLALLRGRNEGVLNLFLDPDPVAEGKAKHRHGQQLICDHFGLFLHNTPADQWRAQIIYSTWRVKILLHMETELIATLRARAEKKAISVFANNMKAMLMAAPAGMRVTLGVDPGLRTGVKLAVVDETGKLVAVETIYPHTGQSDKASKQVVALCLRYGVELVAIGNGTASRETAQFFNDICQRYPHIDAQVVIVSEAGASVYSASELAAQEFPHVDVSLRGAISIARRVQDPMAELVKIEPKAIGVGQYQHDVNQTELAIQLDRVVEDCVNAVGVDLNTASVALLARIAGLNKIIAQNIVSYRDQYGYFNNRQDLLKVNRLGPKAFEQCAAFLRIADGNNPLDSSAVHPEAYPIVEKILVATHQNIKNLMGNTALLRQVNANDFIDDRFGLPTVRDILIELNKPGRDPRPELRSAHFDVHIKTVRDLSIGLVLEGMITNVTNFGAFVDIGIHQDGLVHISCLANTFVTDPHLIVKSGDIVKVKVISLDLDRKRIGLSMCLQEQETATASPKMRRPAPLAHSAMGAALAAALGKQK